MSVSDGTASRYGIEPISTQRIYQEVASQLRRSISEGRLRPGDKLPPERRLAAMFGVSRNTVRDALRALEQSGLIELKLGARRWEHAYASCAPGQSPSNSTRQNYWPRSTRRLRESHSGERRRS